MNKLSEDELETLKTLINRKDVYYFKDVFDNRVRPTVGKLLDLYQQEREKNKELERYKKYYESEKIVWYKGDYISKDKIKDEIEELESMKVGGSTFTTSVNFAVKILNELLKN